MLFETLTSSGSLFNIGLLKEPTLDDNLFKKQPCCPDVCRPDSESSCCPGPGGCWPAQCNPERDGDCNPKVCNPEKCRPA